MSLKQKVIKALKKEIKPPLFSHSSDDDFKPFQTLHKDTSSKSDPPAALIRKKKRKKSSKASSRKHLKTDPRQLTETPQTSSDNVIEVEANRSTNIEWANRFDFNVSPSKSEDQSLTDISLDTIYYNGNDTQNEFFVSPSDSKFDDEDESTEINPTEVDSNGQLIECYNITSGKILILKTQAPVYLHGACKLSVLHGSLSVLGRNLLPSDEEVDFYSLRGFSYLYVRNIYEGGYPDVMDNIKEKLKKWGINKSEVQRIVSEWKSRDTIVICRRSSDLKLAYVEKHISQRLSPSGDFLEIIANENGCDVNVMRCDPKWDQLVHDIERDSIVVICGGKGVGKSNLFRYLINATLMKYDSILAIDLDPGQTEFTIPGCISAVTVEEPLVGPNFTHMRKPDRCIFVSNIDVTIEPDVYIKNVRELLEECRSLSGMPTFINCMGYAQNYGINIISTLITYIAPTVVLQIDSRQRNKNYLKNLTPEVVSENVDMFGKSLKIPSYRHVSIDSMSDGLISFQARGRQIREMMILSYFSEIVDESLSLTTCNVPLYRIALKDVTLICPNSQATENILPVFNANLVGLCSLSETSDVFNCHGWGIVRGVDAIHLVVITPLDGDTLKGVTHLVVGSVTLPASVLMYEDTNSGLVPYVSLGCRTSFNYIPKRSYLSKKTV